MLPRDRKQCIFGFMENLVAKSSYPVTDIMDRHVGTLSVLVVTYNVLTKF